MNYYLINAVLLGKPSERTGPMLAASRSRPAVGHLLLGLHRIRGSVSLIYNIRKQRSLSLSLTHTHTHTHTRSPQIQTCAFAWEPPCVQVGVSEWLRLSAGHCPPMGSWAPPPPLAGGHRAGTWAASAVSPSGDERGWNRSGCVSGWVAFLSVLLLFYSLT